MENEQKKLHIIGFKKDKRIQYYAYYKLNQSTEKERKLIESFQSIVKRLNRLNYVLTLEEYKEEPLLQIKQESIPQEKI